MKTPLNAKQTRTIRPLDPNNKIDAALSGYAARVHGLLSVQAVCSNIDLAASLDDFLGATYAMIFANHEKFSDRLDKSIDITAVRFRAGQLAAHEIRVDGLWMAGFHFNSALFRMAAVYHRLLQIVVGKDGDVPTLQTAAIGMHGNRFASLFSCTSGRKRQCLRT